jgi:DtxR family Mn-dependent transcriptional regulator
MPEPLTPSIEDYLKAIYDLAGPSGRAGTNQIAEHLGVTAASVSGMIKKMAELEPSLVDYQKHHGVSLTLAGERAALEVLRHHRLLEMYLHQVLGYEWDQVHSEADRLEHVISEKFEEHISHVLGDPSLDPHGDPIPSRDLRMPLSPPTVQLSSLRPGQEALVTRVRSNDAALLRYMGNLGIFPQACLKVVAFSPFDRNLTLLIDDQADPIVLGLSVTQQIYVVLK